MFAYLTILQNVSGAGGLSGFENDLKEIIKMDLFVGLLIFGF